MNDIPALSRLAALHAFRDGAISLAEREAALLGSTAAIGALEAEGMLAFYRIAARRQLREIIRPRRADGSLRPYMLADLRLYRAEAQRWRRRTRERRAALATPASAPE